MSCIWRLVTIVITYLQLKEYDLARLYLAIGFTRNAARARAINDLYSRWLREFEIQSAEN